VQRKRVEYRSEVAVLDVRDLVFVDESGIDTRMVRRYGRAAPGKRALGHAPFGRYGRLTIVGALSLDGLLAPMSSTAAMNTELFLGYVDHVLIPELREKKPTAVVVLDNLKPHLAAEVREKLEAAGMRLLYLPPYSPDFAPIEQAWSKLKTQLRSAAARTLEALQSAFAELIDCITLQDTRGYFAHCGYDVL
jgi:transposase